MELSSVSPLGALLAEIREEQTLAGGAGGAGRVASSPAVRSGPEPDLLIETRVVSDPWPSTPGMGRARWPASLLLHVALIAALVLVPLLRSEALPTPARETRAFFVGPASLAVPPPPPPPAASAAAAPRSTPRTPVPPTPPAAASFTVPLDVPEPVGVPAGAAGPVALDQDAGGAAGGVFGGVPGGILGGVVGGVAAPPAPVAPVRVWGGIKEPKKIRHVNPVYPDLALAAHVHGSVILECVVSPQGLVTDVKLVRGIPLLNTSAMDAVKQWMYTPTLKDGVPVPVILTVTVQFDL
jgi:protein TonB